MLAYGVLLKLRACISDQDLFNCFQRRFYKNAHRFSEVLYQAQYNIATSLQNRRQFGKAIASQWKEMSCTQSHLLSISLTTWWCFHVQLCFRLSPSSDFIKKKGIKKLQLPFKLPFSTQVPTAILMRTEHFVCPTQKLDKKVLYLIISLYSFI